MPAPIADVSVAIVSTPDEVTLRIDGRAVAWIRSTASGRWEGSYYGSAPSFDDFIAASVWFGHVAGSEIRLIVTAAGVQDA